MAARFSIVPLVPIAATGFRASDVARRAASARGRSGRRSALRSAGLTGSAVDVLGGHAGRAELAALQQRGLGGVADDELDAAAADVDDEVGLGAQVDRVADAEVDQPGLVAGADDADAQCPARAGMRSRKSPPLSASRTALVATATIFSHLRLRARLLEAARASRRRGPSPRAVRRLRREADPPEADHLLHPPEGGDRRRRRRPGRRPCAGCWTRRRSRRCGSRFGRRRWPAPRRPRGRRAWRGVCGRAGRSEPCWSLRPSALVRD